MGSFSRGDEVVEDSAVSLAFSLSVRLVSGGVVLSFLFRLSPLRMEFWAS